MLGDFFPLCPLLSKKDAQMHTRNGNFINFNKRKEFENSPAEIDERKLCLKIEKF